MRVRLFLCLLLLPWLAPVPARAIPVLRLLDLTGTVAEQSPGAYPQHPASNAIDGRLDTTTATWENTQDPFLSLTLPAAREVRRVVIFNRADCCQDRLRDLTLTFHAGTDSATPPLYTYGVLNPGGVQPAPAFLQLDLPAGITARRITIRRKPGTAPAAGVLSIGEVRLYTAEETALPRGTDLLHADIPGITATQSSTWPGLPATNALDENPATFTATTAEDKNAWWELDLGGEALVETFTIHNRADCCQDRLRDLTINFMDSRRQETGGISFGGAAGNSLTLTTTLLAPRGLTARYIRVIRRSAGTGQDANILSLSGVGVTGGAVITPALTLTPLPGQPRVQLSWPPHTLEYYRLETAPDPRSPWSPLDPGDDQGTTLTVPMEGPRRFYRLRQIVEEW